MQITNNSLLVNTFEGGSLNYKIILEIKLINIPFKSKSTHPHHHNLQSQDHSYINFRVDKYDVSKVQKALGLIIQHCPAHRIFL